MSSSVDAADRAAWRDTAGPDEPRPLRRVVAATIAGNVLEWYDFAVYGYFAAAIGRQFFPADDPTTSLIAALGVFAAGFLARPLGGILFGHVADRMGRRPALLASVVLMVVPTVLIGLLPTHAQIGLAAPVLLLLLRLLQGLSVGGEYATSIVYSTEHAPAARRGLVACSSGLGAIGGMLLGSGVGAAVSALLLSEGVDAWGWRIPFLLGIPLGLIGLFLRRGLEETAPPAPAQPGHGIPLIATVRGHWPELLRIMALLAVSSTGFYLLFVYSVTYLNAVLHESMRLAFDVNTVSVALLLLTYPAGAALSDRVGRRPVLGGFALLTLLAAWPLYALLHSPDPMTVLLAQCGFALVLGPFLGAIPVVLVEAFPRSLRCSAASLAYNVTMAIFGGLAPAAATWLIARTGQDMAPAMMMMATAAISLAAVATLPETARQPLRES